MHRVNHYQKSAGYMMLCALSFALMGALVKILAKTIPVIEIIFFRGFISVVLLAVFSLTLKISLRGNNPKWLFLRSIVGFFALCCNFYALSKINLVDETTLRQSTPLFVMFFSMLLLKEKTRPIMLTIAAVAMIGILLILKPQAQVFNFGGAIAILGSMLAALAYLIIRKLHKSEATPVISFYFALVVSVFGLPFSIPVWVQPQGLTWLLLMGVGFFGAIGQLALTHSYKYAPASWASIFNYLQVPFSFILSLVLLHEIPDSLSMIGIFITSLSCIILLKTQNKYASND